VVLLLVVLRDISRGIQFELLFIYHIGLGLTAVNDLTLFASLLRSSSYTQYTGTHLSPVH